MKLKFDNGKYFLHLGPYIRFELNKHKLKKHIAAKEALKLLQPIINELNKEASNDQNNIDRH